MAKKSHNNKLSMSVWKDIEESDFIENIDIEDVDAASYNEESMKRFAFNVIVARHIPAIEDSLKPVERRILYAMYMMKAYKNNKAKSLGIVGEAIKLHPHGDGSVYKSMVGMAQHFKRGQILVRGIGNFGNAANANEYAHSRYTEASISDYAYECFFEDYNAKSVEMKENVTMSGYEPVALPGKFPNILISGVFGIGYGYNVCIPPYNVNDIIRVTKQLIHNPDAPDIYMYPDLPTGCQIVDDGIELKKICDNGSGKLRMRGQIDIDEEGSKYILTIRSIPWQSSLQDIISSLKAAAASGELPISNLQEANTPVYRKNGKFREVYTEINIRVMINKAYDPFAIREKIYRLTDLDKTISTNFIAICNGIEVQSYNMRSIILTWLDTRREYLRRLYNQQIAEISERLDLLAIMIELTEKNNLAKTVKIIQTTKRSDIPDTLVKKYGMNTHQAKQVSDMRMSAFSADAHDEYISEQTELMKKRNAIMDIIRSEKKIDNQILEDLDDLEKFAVDRKSQIVSPETNVAIKDSDHILVISKKGYVKKLPANKNGTLAVKGYGSFENGDFPSKRLFINNMDSVMMFDSTGKYSSIPVHSFENSSPSDKGQRVHDITKLEGEIISAIPYVSPSEVKQLTKAMKTDLWVVTLSKGGYIKKTAINDYLRDEVIRNNRAIRLRPDDALISADILLGTSNILVYTKYGSFTVIENVDIPEFGKDTQGSSCIEIKPGDECIGFCVLPKKATHIAVLTEKGNMKATAIEHLGVLKKRRETSYIALVDETDGICQCAGVTHSSNIIICKKSSYLELSFTDIPELSRRAKCAKVVPVPNGDNIINMIVT